LDPDIFVSPGKPTDLIGSNDKR